MPQGMLGNSETLRRVVGGPVMDLLVKLNGPDGADYARALAKILRRENVVWPPSHTFELNEHGHYVLEFDGLDLQGYQEIERLIIAGYNVREWAMSCFLSRGDNGYDVAHHLRVGRRYTVALMPSWELERDSHDTIEALYKQGVERYGYSEPLAGIAPRICEAVSNRQMEEMGFRRIVVAHDPIKDSDGDPGQLEICQQGNRRWIDLNWGHPSAVFQQGIALAFLVTS